MKLIYGNINYFKEKIDVVEDTQKNMDKIYSSTSTGITKTNKNKIYIDIPKFILMFILLFQTEDDPN